MKKLLSVGAIVMVATTATAQASETEYRLTACAHATSIGRMMIIETFARGGEPKHRPTPVPAPIRIDTS
jgi:hypothetical protein